MGEKIPICGCQQDDDKWGSCFGLIIGLNVFFEYVLIAKTCAQCELILMHVYISVFLN